MLNWQTVIDSHRIIAEAYDAEAEKIYVRFKDCVEWFFAECPLEVWKQFTAEHQSRGAFIAEVLDFKPNGPRPHDVEIRVMERVGQLTGSTSLDNPRWRRSEDPQKLPLLNDMGRVGVMGVDLGANVEHDADHRLYIFFGDVAIEQNEKLPGFNGGDHMMESDLVAWTDDTQVFRHGGHMGMGFNFFLPNNEEGATAATGQPDWRFCLKCGVLFFAPRGSTAGSVCPKGGEHAHGNVGKGFFLPNDEEHSSRPGGQKDWHFCGRCHGICHSPDSKPVGACPAGGQHFPQGFNFSLPNQPSDPDDFPFGAAPGARPPAGQPDWRFCIACRNLFWSGSAFKGLCPAAGGGGFHLHAVVRNEGRFRNKFAPLHAADPIGYTQTFETPSGAFSHDGRVYVFVGITAPKFSGRLRPGLPACGLYLIGNDNPSSPGIMTAREDDYTPTYRKEFLVSPRMGWCPANPSRTDFESHEILGHHFELNNGGPVGNLNQWRMCRKCESVYWNDGIGRPCWKGGHHEIDIETLPFILREGAADQDLQQSHWRRCRKCALLFFDGFAEKGMCPAGDSHDMDDQQPALLIPFLPETKEALQQPDRAANGHWRFCAKCHAMVKADQRDVFSMAAACRVENRDHDLPTRDGRGVVIMTRSWADGPTEPAFRLAWLPLPASGPPRLQDLRYLADEPEGWSDDPYKARVLLPHPKNFFTSVSLTWLPGPGRWILLYSDNTPDSPPGADKDRLGPVMASLSSDLRKWSEPFRIFDPRCAHAYGVNGYMHEPSSGDTMHLDVPPLPVLSAGVRENRAGCAYGAFLLQRFTTWNASTRDLELYYLLSTGRPYQVQLMHSTVRLGPTA